MKPVKIFALYLPQFHTIPENDDWWGKGFTEWVNVKRAIKYTDTQIQPRVPLEGYYDLADVNEIEKQCKLANDYNVDGFCIYHYYSKGKKLLNKPAELLRNNKDIDIEYFFSWANHDWRRTWASSGTEMLLKQEYGDNNDILEHYNYLNEFFYDERYVKINNKPVLVLYQDIPFEVFREIHRTFDFNAKKNGFDGIYWIGTLKSNLDTFSIQMDNYYKCEADYTRNSSNAFHTKFILKSRINGFLKKIKIQSLPYSIKYKTVVENINSYSNKDKKFIQGVCCGWDNTPRHKENGYYYDGFNFDLFKKHLENQYNISQELDNEFLIINAWNEWGEGAYLEPDLNNEYSLLEIIKNVRRD